MNTAFKISVTFLFLFAYLFASFLISVLPVSERARRSMRIRSTSFFSRLGLALFGVRVHVNRGSLPRTYNGCLVVSNHLSYLDVLDISSLLPSVFITSVELKRTPVLGMLARFGGSLFVERRKPSGLKQELRDITRTLDQRFPVVLFPEGTTSNGDCVGQFKNPLFDAAVSAKADIFPFCLRYTKINGEPVSNGNRDAVFYYGGMKFFRHLPMLLSRKSVDVEVSPLKAVAVGAGSSRKELAALAYDAIDAAYQAGRASGQAVFADHR